MAATLMDSKIHQANFIKTIGAVLPNARIDFQLQPSQIDAKHVLPPALPDVRFGQLDCTDNQKTAALGRTGVVTSDCSTSSESMVEQSVQIESSEARTPEAGTPEWTPRRTCADPALAPQGLQEYLSEHTHAAPQMWVMPEPTPPEPTPRVTQAWSTMTGYGDYEMYSWYRVTFLGGVELRIQPSFLAGRSGVVLPQNEVFAVSAEILGADGRIYLRLADGRGWAFDDSALLPQDPSVMRVHFVPTNYDCQAASPCSYSYAGAAPPVQGQQDGAAASSMTTAFSTSPYSGPSGPLESPTPPCNQAGLSVQTNVAVSTAQPVTMSHAYSEEGASPADVGMPWVQTVTECQPVTWSLPVTSDCPPTWEPMVGRPVA